MWTGHYNIHDYDYDYDYATGDVDNQGPDLQCVPYLASTSCNSFTGDASANIPSRYFTLSTRFASEA